ncbi:MAG: hypothetical protein L3K02_04275, partial [Thermoplasmata archaeon]|nr:hypothetical protein [Thermoplasmata archaeon]
MLRSSSLVVPLAFAVVMLLTVPGLLASGSPVAVAAPRGAGSVDPTLTLNPGHPISSLFWGTTVDPRAHLLPNQGDLVNATPVRTVVFPGAVAGDQFNPFNSSVSNWVRLSIKVNGTHPTVLEWNSTAQHGTSVRAFVTWCESINCTAIFQVPGEIDDPGFARNVVAYVVNTTYNATTPGLDFRPAYWEIGNEPGLWTNWNLSWKDWKDTNNINVTPIQYAWEVHNYTAQMDLANSSYTPRIIGLPGIGKGSGTTTSNGDWANDTILVNGFNLSGIAIHIYPASGAAMFNNTTIQTNWTRTAFYDVLDSGTNSLLDRINAQDRSDCRILYGFSDPTCTVGGVQQPTIPTFVTEVGPSLSHYSFGVYSLGFPGALGYAVEMIQAMNYNPFQVASVDQYAAVFGTTNSWFSLNGTARPDYTAYSQFLNHLGNDVFNINVAGTSEVNAIATLDRNASDRVDLLVTNTNLSSSANFSSYFINSTNPALGAGVLPAAFHPTDPVEEWAWSGTPSTYVLPVDHGCITSCLYNTSVPATPAPVPVAYFPHGLPSMLSVPPESLVLFESFNAPASPVNFSESGLQLSGATLTPHWFLEVNGTAFSSNSPTLTLLLPPGSYRTDGAPVLVPGAGSALLPQERYFPVVPSTTVVGSSPLNVSVSFAQQWAINVSWDPTALSVVSAASLGGPGLPAPSWWTNNTPLTLRVRPRPGYAFTGWYGQGLGSSGNTTPWKNGSVSGYLPLLTIVPRGSLEEIAEFAPGYAVTFTEKGLAAGIPWNVTLREFNVSTANLSTTFYEPNGTWGYTVANVSGYQFNWWNRTVNVTGTPSNPPLINFTKLTPAGTRYNVTFIESGLPVGAAWALTFAGT